jgi:hypothetical protein
MTITLSKAINVNGAIVDLVTKDKENKLVFTSAIRYRLADALSSLRHPLENYQNRNNELVEKYGKPDAKDPSQKIVLQDAEGWPEFKKEMEALLDEEVDVKVKPLTEEELSNAETKDYRVDVPSIVALRELGLLVSTKG